MTINSFCGVNHSARLLRWRANSRIRTQLHIESNSCPHGCKGCGRYRGCCSCRVCGGIGTQEPATEDVQHRHVTADVTGAFQICHKLTHEVQFSDFGSTTAVAVCGKFVFAGSDSGAVAVWECGVGGAVERVAGWWLEGESVSALLPARSGEQLFILVGMHGGRMYSFDIASQLH